MKQVKIALKAEVNGEYIVDELKDAVENHIERFISLDDWPEITCIYGATLEVVDENEINEVEEEE